MKRSRRGPDIDTIIRRWKRAKPRIPRIAGQEAVNFFKENILRRQGFKDRRTKRWKKRKGDKDPGRALLVKSSNLVSSIRVEQVRPASVTVSAGDSDVPYSEIHNKGGQIKGSFKVRRHRRGRSTVKEHTRKVDIKIPQRQYMGRSQALNEIIKKRVRPELKKVFR